MTEKKAERMFVIYESELQEIGQSYATDVNHRRSARGRCAKLEEIRSRPLSDMGAQGQHDEQVKREAREEVLDEICAINKGDGCCTGQPHGKDCFDCEFIHLRSEVKKP